MLKAPYIIAFLSVLLISCKTQTKEENQPVDTSEKVILITLDGLRWQEVFSGIDSLLLHNPEYTKDKELIASKFWDNNLLERRKKLMPFLWSTIANEGFVYGNRILGSKANLKNKYWFSYPGYNEILTGFADDERISSNNKIDNPNKTVLELATEQGYHGQVAAFASWDRFKFIINENRSGVPVNDGYNPSTGDSISEKEAYLNHLQKQAIKPWSSVRQDVFTHNYALEYMKRKHPKFVYVSYGETDDFAHDGNYTHYVLATKNTDAMIQELWEFCQSDDFYRGKTSIIITTDHGRGTEPLENWQHHGNKPKTRAFGSKVYTIKGSDEVWFAGLGSQIKALGESKEENLLYSTQIAPTVAKLLGISMNEENIGTPIIEFLK